MSRPKSWQIYSGLLVGMLGVSMGSILVRLAGEISPLTVAFYRLLGACLFLVPVALHELDSSRLFRVSRSQAVAGVCLAIHFACWIASLSYTSVAVSVVLTNGAPVLVAIASRYLFGERLTRMGVTGMLAFSLGTWLLFRSSLDPGQVKGALLALGGAVGLAGYLVAGRHARQRKNLIEYALPCYAIGCLVLLGVVLLTHSPLKGFSAQSWLYLALLGLIPQAIGHTSYNWALGFFPATVVAVLILAEPVLAPLLGWWILAEPVTAIILPGATLILLGIVLVAGWGVATPSGSPARQGEK